MEASGLGVSISSSPSSTGSTHRPRISLSAVAPGTWYPAVICAAIHWSSRASISSALMRASEVMSPRSTEGRLSQTGTGGRGPGCTSQTRLVVTAQMILDLLALGLSIRVFIGAIQLARQAHPDPTDPAAPPEQPPQ